MCRKRLSWGSRRVNTAFDWLRCAISYSKKNLLPLDLCQDLVTVPVIYSIQPLAAQTFSLMPRNQQFQVHFLAFNRQFFCMFLSNKTKHGWIHSWHLSSFWNIKHLIVVLHENFTLQVAPPVLSALSPRKSNTHSLGLLPTYSFTHKFCLLFSFAFMLKHNTMF